MVESGPGRRRGPTKLEAGIAVIPPGVGLISPPLHGRRAELMAGRGPGSTTSSGYSRPASSPSSCLEKDPSSQLFYPVQPKARS